MPERHNHETTPMLLDDKLLARWYFNQYPPHTWADQHGQKQVHLLFAGFSPLVEALICQYARISPYKDFTPPVFTLLGHGAEKYRELLVSRYPVFANDRTGAEQVIAGLYALECDDTFILAKTQLEQITTPTEGTCIPVSAVLFCANNDEWNVQQAMSLHQQALMYGGWQAPFYVRMENRTNPTGQLIPFGSLECACDLEQLERSARAMHEAYRESQRQQQQDMSTDSLQPWENLAETYRSANFRSADHLPVKLASIGYPPEPGKPLHLAPSVSLLTPPERLALLSRLEHRSWRYDRLLNGWRYGDKRDNQQKMHPSIILWEDLSESERIKDAEQLQYLEEMLHKS